MEACSNPAAAKALAAVCRMRSLFSFSNRSNLGLGMAVNSEQ
jgi:hypothetical protein